MRLDQINATIAAVFVGLVADDSEPEGKEPRHVFAWTVTIRYQGRDYTGNYRAGVAHCTRTVQDWRTATKGQHGRNPPATVHVTREIARVFKPFGPLTLSDCEGEVYPTPPTVAGYLSCLQLDARAGEHLLFEDYCDEFGDDPDSRRAEKCWRACQEVRGHMQRLFGADFGAFMEATEDD
jgi:hypothetical protein